MDTLTAVALMMIEAKPANVPDLVLRVSEELSIFSNQELFDILAGVLDRLTVAGLIESAPQ